MVGGRKVLEIGSMSSYQETHLWPPVVAEAVAASQPAHWHGSGPLLKRFQSWLLHRMQEASTGRPADPGTVSPLPTVKGDAASRKLGRGTPVLGAASSHWAFPLAPTSVVLVLRVSLGYHTSGRAVSHGAWSPQFVRL